MVCPVFEPGDHMLPEFGWRVFWMRSSRIVQGDLSCVRGGELLGLSDRHFRRLRDAYEDRGEGGWSTVGENG